MNVALVSKEHFKKYDALADTLAEGLKRFGELLLSKHGTDGLRELLPDGEMTDEFRDEANVVFGDFRMFAANRGIKIYTPLEHSCLCQHFIRFRVLNMTPKMVPMSAFAMRHAGITLPPLQSAKRGKRKGGK